MQTLARVKSNQLVKKTTQKAMQIQTIIGLTGLAGTGKDTVANLLCTHLQFARYAFAEPMRHEIGDAFGIDHRLLTDRPTKELPTPELALARCVDQAFVGTMYRHLTNHDAKDFFNQHEAPRSPRQIMQWWGTEYRRENFGPDYWSRKLINRVYAQQTNGQRLHVVTDVRFPEEVRAIELMGGEIWQVKRPQSSDQPAVSAHSSEVDGSAFKPTVVINNSHDIKHLQHLVLGAYFMRTAKIDAADLMSMGLVQLPLACEQWAEKKPKPLFI